MRRGPHLAFALALVWSLPSAAQAACDGDVAHAATRTQASYESGQATVRGLIYRPARPNGAGVVLLHGARGLAADAQTFDPHAIQLASRGYHVLVPNYYDAQPGRQNRTDRDLRLWRGAARDGAAFLGSQPGMEPGRVALWGYSLGGFLSGETAMEADAVAAAVSVAGGLDAGEAGRAGRPVPVLLIHARRDPVISPESTRRWGDGLRRRGATVEIQALRHEGHGLGRAAWCDVFERTRTFLDRALIGGEAGS
ncbi:alpha/beta hydrolase family protein [Brevundimonas sp.]|uniref:alpha/beta hydrolase family protein n=1 Tax=Brevundimonas sp. TaxID=1871086 RepID=UPI002FC94955